MRFPVIFGVVGLFLSGCVVSEFTDMPYFVSVDGKRYKVIATSTTRRINPVDEETTRTRTVYVDGVGYACAGDCSQTVQRVLEETRRRKVITKYKPDAKFPALNPVKPSH